MQETDDIALLRQYTEQNSEEAFATLVTRHIDRVYSVALRHTRNPSHAEEITQAVFVILARKAKQLRKGVIIEGWLYQTARLTALTFLKGEIRRARREQEAYMQTASTENESEVWAQIAPELDAALAGLNQTDRNAVVLRFFYGKSMTEIGKTLGANEDAARMRVNRALEKLRQFFVKRGIVSTTATIAGAISANSVQAAPAGLAAIISSTALSGTTITTAAVIAATKAIAMTTFQKTIVTTALVVTTGAGIFEAHQAAQLRAQNETLQQQQASLTAQISQLNQSLADATNQVTGLLAENKQLKPNSNENELLKLRGEVTRLNNEANNETASVAKAWLVRLNNLKNRLEQNPNARIPEMQFLTEQDWLNAASQKLETDADYRRALAWLRNVSENRFAAMYHPALQQYLDANNNQFPTDVSQLQSYFNPPIDETILQQWKFIPANGNANQGFAGSDWVLTQKAPIDELFDSRYTISLHGSGSTDFFYYDNEVAIGLLQKAFFAANPSASMPPPHPPTASDLMPYATTPEQQAVVQQMLLRESALK